MQLRRLSPEANKNTKDGNDDDHDDRHTGGPWGTLAQVEPALAAWKPKTEARLTAVAWREAMRSAVCIVGNVLVLKMGERREGEAQYTKEREREGGGG